MKYLKTRLRLIPLRIRGKKVTTGPCVCIALGASLKPGNGEIILGPQTVIRKGAILRAMGGKIRIGAESSVGYYSVLCGHGDLTIGDKMRIAPGVHIYASDRKYMNKTKPIMSQGFSNKGIKIGNDIIIGAGSIVLDGSVIPDGCFIGALSKVTKKDKLRPYCVYDGNPLRFIRERKAPAGCVFLPDIPPVVK